MAGRNWKMSRSKLSLAVLLVVALVVGLEEWRIAGWRGKAREAERKLELAMADLPPPPRPEDKGAANSVVGASRIRRIKDRNDDLMGVEAATGGAAEPVAVVEGPGESVGEGTNDPAQSVNYQASASQMYAALVDEFQLNDTERAYFLQLMAEGMSFQDELAVESLAATTLLEQAAVARKRAEAEKVFGKKIRHFLGNDRDFAIYHAYVQKLSERLAGEAGGAGGR